MALLPVNLTWDGSAQPMKAVFKKAKKPKKNAIGDQALVANAGQGVAGFAVVVGEKATHGSFDQFVQKITKEVDVAIAEDGRVTLTDGDRGSVSMVFGDDATLPAVWRNGQAHDWATDHRVQWQGVGNDGPITAGWRERTISVDTGGFTFQGTIDENGTYSWSETLAE